MRLQFYKITLFLDLCLFVPLAIHLLYPFIYCVLYFYFINAYHINPFCLILPVTLYKYIIKVL